MENSLPGSPDLMNSYLISLGPLPDGSQTLTGPDWGEPYEAGRVICQVCGTGIAFRDEATNEFTMKYWDAHHLAWNITIHVTLMVLIANPIYQSSSSSAPR